MEMRLSPAELRARLGANYGLARERSPGLWEGEDLRHHRPVLLRFLPVDPDRLPVMRVAVERALSLQHPRIVPLLDSGDGEGLLWLVFPRVEGETLRERLIRTGPLPVPEAIRCLMDIADALASAHDHGLRHGDVRPETMLLSGRHALLSDVGVAAARSAAAESADGSAAYLAPEIVSGEGPVDHRADLYALGATGYELLSGRPPFEADTTQGLLTAQLLDEPQPLDERRAGLPPGLGPGIMRLLAKDPGARWQSAADFLGMLEPIAMRSGESAPAGTLPSRLPRALLVSGALLLAFAGWWVTGRETPRGGEMVQRPGTSSGQVISSAISPDGRTIAFVTNDLGANRVVVQDLPGGTERVLAHGRLFSRVSWSGDGSAVRYFGLAGDTLWLYEIPRLGGEGRRLKARGWSTLSPDSRRVATAAPSSVLQGRTPFMVTDLSTGDSLVFRGDTGFWQSPPAWSNDGRWLAWSQENIVTGHGRIRVTRSDTLRPSVVYQDSIAIGAPAWDGDNALLFFRAAGSSADLLRLPLTSGGTPGGPAVPIAAGLLAGSPKAYTAFYAPVSVATTGIVAYTRWLTWSNLEAAWVDEWNRGAGTRPVTNGMADYRVARFSRDGRQTAVVQNDLQGTTLRVLDLDTHQWQEGGRLSEWFGIGWSPDGSRIAATVQDPGRGEELRIFRPARPEVASYLAGSVGDSPEWVDDSTLITPGKGNRRLQWVRLPAGSAEPLPGLDTVGWMNWPRLSPDRKSIAFMWNRGGNAGAGIYAFRLGGRDATLLAQGALVPVRWSADGREVYVASNGFFADTTRVWALTVPGGGRRLLGAFPPELQVQDVRPDGRVVLVIHRQNRSDAWLLEPRAAGQ